VKFEEFKFEKVISDNINSKGFTDCTPIQEASIPSILNGSDLSGLAQTGTGKTAAYLLPLIDRILKSKIETKPEGFSDKEWALRRFENWGPTSFVLVLVPTRELADQVQNFCQEIISSTDLDSVKVYGGESYDKQINAIKGGVQFIFATPGRLIDLYKKEKIIDFKQIKAIIFDEADRMFDMGFKDDMKYILNRAPKDRQFLIFSATLNFDVLNVAYSHGASPVEVDVSRDSLTTDNVKDGIYHIGRDEKPQYLASLLKKENPRQAIVFSNFKIQVEKLTQFLQSNGVQAMGISSLLTQAQRQRVIDKLKTKDENYILVATDVAARGLDIKEVDMVINYELPDDAENYVHRIGRTGRAGAKGVAYSLVCESDVEALTRIQNYLDKKLPIEWMEESDLTPTEELKPMPRNVRSKNYKAGDKKTSGNRNRRPRADGKRPARDPNKKPDDRPRKQYNKKADSDKPRKKYNKKTNSDKPRKQYNKKATGDNSKADTKDTNFDRKKKPAQKRTRTPNKDPKYKKVYGSKTGPENSGGVKGKVKSILRKLFD